MTGEARYVVRSARDAHRRRERVECGELDVPLAEHLPPIERRGRDEWGLVQARRERRRNAERLLLAELELRAA